MGKVSCYSGRVGPVPMGMVETSFNIPIRGTGPAARLRWDAIARGFMFGDPDFVSCRHRDCWVCMGQSGHPSVRQVAAFKPQLSSVKQRFPYGLLSGETYKNILARGSGGRVELGGPVLVRLFYFNL